MMEVDHETIEKGGNLKNNHQRIYTNAYWNKF